MWPFRSEIIKAQQFPETLDIKKYEMPGGETVALVEAKR